MGPFAVSFGIALFVLIMQFLWLYIDEIAGKGVSLLVLVELISYLSISTFPMALPIAVIISSVMVMGNLAERYELSSMKSAGVSLIRIMRVLIVSSFGIAVFSYVCADFLIPISNLKFKSRLYDIRKQKPALTLEKGVFNEDFRQFVIRIGDKKSDGETISDILIEDQTNIGRLSFNQILADSGQMYTTDDNRFFVMNLFRGTQYQEPGSNHSIQRQRYPFVRTNFQSWSKVWDMKEFEMTRTDDDRFKSQRSMLSMKQLRFNVDSLNKLVVENRKSIAFDMMANVRKELIKPVQSIPPKAAPGATKLKEKNFKSEEVKRKAEAALHDTQNKQGLFVSENKSYRQVIDKPLTSYGSLLETFPEGVRPAIQREARARSSFFKNILINHSTLIRNRQMESVKTAYELYSKYSFALVCFVFVFIGAPMGAIIRKGGFGYPVLVSIIFFVTFIMLTILCRKFAELFVLTPFWAAMVPCFILTPVAVILTRRAQNDSQMLQIDRFQIALIKLSALIMGIGKRNKKHKTG